MKILVLNCGSSSFKYQLIDMDNEKVLAKGTYERIGEGNSFLTHKVNGEKYVLENPVDNHKDAIDFALKQLTNPEYKVIDSLDEISAVGHRIVHGGEKFNKSVLIDENVEEAIKECIPLAPLHNPAGLLGIEACKKEIPNAKMVAVFDTAFHQTMKKEQYIYPLPYEYYEKYGIRKYGFHGTSHMYVSKRVAEIMGEDIKNLKIINCHLGQGASLCAIKNGESYDTTMGLTPLGGIPMCTRSGDLDPSIVTFLMKNENMTADEVEKVLNKKSGVLGISGVSPDFRDVEAEKANGNERAKLAIENYNYNVAGFISKFAMAIENYNYNVAGFISKFAMAMDGVDVITFTAGIGENQIKIRKGICEHLKFLGVEIDDEANNVRSEERLISTKDSKVKVYIVPTNEELMIARDTKELISK